MKKYSEDAKFKGWLDKDEAAQELSEKTGTKLSSADALRCALTGPLSRGDTETIVLHLKTLAGDPFQAVYAAFVRAYEQRT